MRSTVELATIFQGVESANPLSYALYSGEHKSNTTATEAQRIIDVRVADVVTHPSVLLSNQST